MNRALLLEIVFDVPDDQVEATVDHLYDSLLGACTCRGSRLWAWWNRRRNRPCSILYVAGRHHDDVEFCDRCGIATPLHSPDGLPLCLGHLDAWRLEQHLFDLNLDQKDHRDD